jgi:hypothetical protein
LQVPGAPTRFDLLVLVIRTVALTVCAAGRRSRLVIAMADGIFPDVACAPRTMNFAKNEQSMPIVVETEHIPNR